MEPKTVCLCKNCIDAILSRGEKVFVGNEIEPEEPEQTLKCIWCEENDMPVYECVW